MAARSQLVGGTAAPAASSASAAVARRPGRWRKLSRMRTEEAPESVFLYQSGERVAVEAGRIMTRQGVRVVEFAETDRDALEELLREVWPVRRTRVVGFTHEAGYRQARSIAAEFGSFHSHSAPANRGRLVNWIIVPV